MTDETAAERALADSALKTLIEELGMAFHPDMRVNEYVRAVESDSEVIPTFEEDEARFLQACLDIAWHVYGDGIYDEVKKIEPWKSYFEELDKEQGEH